VEFVLILPILLLLVFGIIQFAYYFFQLQQGISAAREAARQAAVGTLTCTQLTQLVGSAIAIPAPVTTSISAQTPAGATIPANSDVAIGDNLTVTVQFQAADFGFPFIPFPNNAAVDQDAQVRIENVTANTNATGARYNGCSGTVT
jgi:Flp pilus assembly protein TadG